MPNIKQLGLPSQPLASPITASPEVFKGSENKVGKKETSKSTGKKINNISEHLYKGLVSCQGVYYDTAFIS